MTASIKTLHPHEAHDRDFECTFGNGGAMWQDNGHGDGDDFGIGNGNSEWPETNCFSGWTLEAERFQ